MKIAQKHCDNSEKNKKNQRIEDRIEDIKEEVENNRDTVEQA